MGRPSTIKRLPREARARLDELLRDEGVTQTEAADLINTLLRESTRITRRCHGESVNRYVMARRGAESWRKALGRDRRREDQFRLTAAAAAAAGDKIGALVAPLIPFELRMSFVKALVSRLDDDPFDAVAAQERAAGLAAEVELTPEEARAGSGLSFTLGELAKACGVPKSRIQKLAVRAGWRYTREPRHGVCGCRNLYPFEELPGYVARKALAWRARRGAK